MKSKLYFAAVSVALGLNVGIVHAQNISPCGTSELLEKQIQEHPELLKQMQEFQKYQGDYIQKQKGAKVTSVVTYIIPVVFHVIHNYGTENISDAQINDAINVLNRDFQKMNADTISVKTPFNDIIANCRFEFRLAKKDPQGKCTNGIERIQSLQTYIGGSSAKLNPWPKEKYLNIWTTAAIKSEPGETPPAAYATFPASSAGFYGPLDGILSLSNYVGSIGTSSITNSRTLTHEVGHWLSLQHVWGSNNDVATACGDDGIDDTPKTKGHQTCPAIDYTCSLQSIAKIYTFDSVKTTSGVIDPTPVPIGNSSTDTLVVLSSFSAIGVSANPINSNAFSFSDWGTGSTDHDTTYASLSGSLDANKYYEVKFTPKYGKGMSINTVKFNFSRSATGVRTFSVRSSKNNYATNLAASVSDTLIKIRSGNVFFCKWDTTKIITGCTVSLPGATDSPITLRFYGWNAESVSGTFGIDDVIVTLDGGVVENIENYMEYSYCVKMFTPDQKTAMEAALNSSVAGRSNLWTPANLAATGVDGSVTTTCAPIADFYSFGNYGCSGVNFLFYDVSWNGQVDNRTWTFSNATPSTSTLQNESVVFNTSGWQTVSLTVSNTNGSDTKTVTKQVFISDPVTSQRTGTIVEDFENAAEFDSDWFVINQPVDINNSSKWQLTNTASHLGSKSLMLNSYFPSGYPNFPFSSGSGDVDEFITPSIDLTGVNPIYLNFWYSYATKAFKSADITESLKIYFSSNCGKNWTLDTTLSGAPFLTGGSISTSYVPNNASLWKLKSVLLSPSIAKGNIRFKFQYNSGPYSNNLYIDDINISADHKVGVNENENSVNSLSVFPNPANESATITYHIDQKQDVELSLYDILGNKVRTLVNQTQDDGDYAYKINKQSVVKGMYFIRLNIDNKNTAVKKFILLD